MFYVLIELNLAHSRETPKDHTSITSACFKIVDAQDMVVKCNETANSINNLQDWIDQLDKSIANYIPKTTEFLIVSWWSTWHLRVTLQRQCRDNNIILPDYMVQSKILDLWKEFDLWRNIVSEEKDLAMTNTGSQWWQSNDGSKMKEYLEVINILKNLDKTTIQSDNFIEPVDEQDQNLQIEIHCPKIDCTYNIIKFLHDYKEDNKSNNENLNKLLSTPYDLQIDYSVFNVEQSAVLYMNNLPPDTTQSELESWFTQFGVKPVGLWTFKTQLDGKSNINSSNSFNINNKAWLLHPYTEEQDSISGFVILSSFEKAQEALQLNGRSILSNVANIKQPRIVEYVVEIQPSSMQVIELAQDVLISFPQSKNKPRPGDWNCPSCGFSNFQRRTACFRCSFPLPTSMQKTFINGNNNSNNSSNNNNSMPVLNDNGRKFNSNMNNMNSGINNFNINYNMNNNNNNTNRFSNSHMRYSSSNGNNFNNKNNNNNNTNNSNNNNNIHNGNNNSNNINSNSNNGNNNNSNINIIPFRAGDWKCINCEYHNFAKNVVCLRCNGPKYRNTGINMNNVGMGNTNMNKTNNNNNIDNNTNGNIINNVNLNINLRNFSR